MDVNVKIVAADKPKKPKEVVKVAGEARVKTATKHIGQVQYISPRGKGLVTLVDSHGNEFSIPEKEYVKYYSDETKFTVKKKAI